MAPSPQKLVEEPRCLSVLLSPAGTGGNMRTRPPRRARGNAGEQRLPHVLVPFPWHDEIRHQVKERAGA